MPVERSQQVEQLYHDARKRDQSERAVFLKQACGGDYALRRKVESLLAQDSNVESFLETPALELAKKMSGEGASQSMIGRQFGPYSVASLVAKGGMGEIYRARDTKLGRDVALKILPATFARDPERLTRFQREARLLASLNHPHIAAIYGMEESGGLHGLVMELVPGETLANAGPLPLLKALTICLQIAEGLEEAHRKNITHRDVKPANVKVTPEGIVKILDFGLAKAMAWEQSEVDLSELPTVSAVATEEGRILGTPGYMSPEQVRGKAVDKQTDIWAFGCLMYELLTGKHAFHRETLTDTIAAVLERDPDWQALPPATPAAVRDLLRRCLQKDKDRRLRDIGDARIEIEEKLCAAPAVALPDASHTRSPWLAWIVAAIATLAFVSTLVLYFRQGPVAEPAEMRLEIATPSTAFPLDFALSPDGRYIVFVASGDGPQRLWLRALDKTESQPMAGTEGASFPFWSADSRSIGFFATGKLKRIDIAGGPPQALANTSLTISGAWNADGTILFNTTGFAGPLSRVSATGGDPVVVTRLAAGQASHRFPRFLPDGRYFLFWAIGSPEASGIYLGSLDGGEPKRLTAADSYGAYFASGMIVFIRQTTLMAQHFDLKRGELTGDPVRLADPVSLATGIGGFSVSVNKQLAYRFAGRFGQLRWYDRTGKVVGVAGDLDPNAGLYPALSPDGGRVILQRTVQANSDLWLMDLIRGGMTRLTFDPSLDSTPLWSPDGTRMAYVSNRKSVFNLYWKPSSGAGAEDLLLETPNNKFTNDWSKDGRFLLYTGLDPKTGRDLWVLPITGNDRKPIMFVKTPFEETNGQFSPDGRWVAYETDESGQFQIVVQPFPVPNAKWQVSTGGGTQPRWRADGKELYFIAPDEKLMAVPVTATDVTFAAGIPAPLFSAPLVRGGGANRQEYAVSRDGRFLLNQPAEPSTTPPITRILNWNPKP